MPINKRKIGAKYEDIAEKFLNSKGIKVIEKNFYCSFGEIDLIARDKEYLVFIEVKYRKDITMGMPSESVDIKKIRKISMSSIYYIQKNKISENTPCRFDVILILGEDIKHIPDAFESCY